MQVFRPTSISLSWESSQDEKLAAQLDFSRMNPVVDSAEFAYKATNLVQIDPRSVEVAADYENPTHTFRKQIKTRLSHDSYTPRTWRTHSLHICPPEPYDPTLPLTKTVFDWIFLISALNFSFWSSYEVEKERYGVEWYAGWEEAQENMMKQKQVFTGYWSLVAALDRALWDEDIPFVNPEFYSSETMCPDSLIEYIFRPAPLSTERMPLIQDRIRIMREVGFILCNSYGGSFKGFIDEFHQRYHGEGSALDLVKMVTEAFPSFRDQVVYQGRTVYFWKRAQILVAELWAAFYPPTPSTPHPIFPGPQGPRIHELTMFADYRVPQILHHLRILKYPVSLMQKLASGTDLMHGCREEVSLRAASIVAVEQVRVEILRLMDKEGSSKPDISRDVVSSVLIDFYLWDLAKRIEDGEDKIQGIATAPLVPIHRTRSIWY